MGGERPNNFSFESAAWRICLKQYWCLVPIKLFFQVSLEFNHSIFVTQKPTNMNFYYFSKLSIHLDHVIKTKQFHAVASN